MHSFFLLVIDASAKVPSGILSLNTNDYGDYYECLNINKYVDDFHVEGKYCFIRVPIQQTITMPTWYNVAKMSRTFSAGTSVIDDIVKVEKYVKNLKDAPEIT